MLTTCKKLPSDVKSISPGIIQSHANSYMNTSGHTHTLTFISCLREQFSVYTFSDSLVHAQLPSSLSISPKIKLVSRQPLPACLAACTICCQLGKEGVCNSRQAPASAAAGTAKPSSGEIIRALVKSQRRSVGRFPLPQEMKRRRGGRRGGERERQKKGQRLKREVAEPHHVTWTISGISE